MKILLLIALAVEPPAMKLEDWLNTYAFQSYRTCFMNELNSKVDVTSYASMLKMLGREESRWNAITDVAIKSCQDKRKEILAVVDRQLTPQPTENTKSKKVSKNKSPKTVQSLSVTELIRGDDALRDSQRQLLLIKVDTQFEEMNSEFFKFMQILRVNALASNAPNK